MKILKNNQGFTLVELLVSITIMSIILVMSLPVISNIQTRNTKQRYERYSEALESAAKLYTDSNDIDMFGYENKGCYDISFEKLEEKKLIKDIDYKDVSCADKANKLTYVRVKKAQGEYTYQVSIVCRNSKNGLEYEKLIAGKEAICTEESANEAPKITLSPKSTTWTNDKNYQVAMTISDQDGLLENAEVEYSWNTSSELAGAKFTGLNLKNARYKQKITRPIKRPSADGSYYLIVRPKSVQDVFNNATIDYVAEGVYNFDTIAPIVNTFTVVSTDGQAFIRSSGKVTLNATDERSGLDKYCFSDVNDVSKCKWNDYTTTFNISVTPKPGELKRTSYVWVKDKAGNISSAKSYTYTVYIECTEVVDNGSACSSYGACSDACGGQKYATKTVYKKDKYTGKTCPSQTINNGCVASCGGVGAEVEAGRTPVTACSNACGGTQTIRVTYQKKSTDNSKVCSTRTQDISQNCGGVGGEYEASRTSSACSDACGGVVTTTITYNKNSSDNSKVCSTRTEKVTSACGGKRAEELVDKSVGKCSNACGGTKKTTGTYQVLSQDGTKVCSTRTATIKTEDCGGKKKSCGSYSSTCNNSGKKTRTCRYKSKDGTKNCGDSFTESTNCTRKYECRQGTEVHGSAAMGNVVGYVNSYGVVYVEGTSGSFTKVLVPASSSSSGSAVRGYIYSSCLTSTRYSSPNVCSSTACPN